MVGCGAQGAWKAECGMTTETTGSRRSCLLLPAGLHRVMGMCSSMDSWFSDPRTIATAGGLVQRIYARVGISGSTLDSFGMVLGRKRGG